MVLRDNVMSEETKSKKVSVVVCTYNGEQFLREQLESVVNQTFPLHEIIIQDDGSTDRTMQIAMEYANRYDNIIVKSNRDKQGINGNFFSAMRSCTGDFIAICDQDDLWARDKIELQVAAIGYELMCTCHRADVYMPH